MSARLRQTRENPTQPGKGGGSGRDEARDGISLDSNLNQDSDAQLLSSGNRVEGLVLELVNRARRAIKRRDGVVSRERLISMAAGDPLPLDGSSKALTAPSGGELLNIPQLKSCQLFAASGRPGRDYSAAA